MRRNYNRLLFYKHTDKEVLVYFPTRRSALRGVSPKSKGKSGSGLEAQRAAIQRFAEAVGITLIAEHVEIGTPPVSSPLVWSRRPTAQLACMDL
jgi:hypothetical protein